MPELEGRAGRPVLVTGSSSGIGRAVCEFLATKECTVIAGARRTEDLEALAKIPRVRPIRLDVTSPGDVGRAVAQVQEWGQGLHGLVNCAGVAGLGALLDTSQEEFDRVVGVNLASVHRLVRAFGPMICASQGRIVNMSSIGGFMTETWLGPYGTSKHGLEGYSEVLRDELARLGVHVSTIEPGAFRSRMGENFYNLIGGRLESLWTNAIFRDQMREVADWYQNTPGAIDRSTLPEPTPVAEAVFSALFSENPKARYLVADADTATKVIDEMLRRVVEVNRGQATPLSGAELVERLHKALG